MGHLENIYYYQDSLLSFMSSFNKEYYFLIFNPILNNIILYMKYTNEEILDAIILNFIVFNNIQ